METCQGLEFSTFPWRDTTGAPPFVEVLQSVLTDHLPHFSDNFKCWGYTKILVIYRSQISLRSRGESFKLLKAIQMPCILRSSCSLHVSCQASKSGFAISSNPISSPAWAPPLPVGLLQISQSGKPSTPGVLMAKAGCLPPLAGSSSCSHAAHKSPLGLLGR